MSYMGLDIGQTGCKAIVFDEDGTQLSSSYREYDTIIPQSGWAELDSEYVVNQCFKVMSEAQKLCSKKPISSLAISSQGEAFTPVSKDGTILSNAMITFDTRATKITAKWIKRFGAKKLYSITGHTAHPMFSLFKLLWIKENRNELFNNTWKFLCFEDLIQFKLGLEPHISWPLAARTMMFNIHTHQWDDEILHSAGFRKEAFSIPVSSGRIVGTINNDIARELGFRQKVNVVSAGHDQPVGALGAGVLEEGRAMYAIGTSEAIVPVFHEPIINEALFTNNLCTYDYTIKGLYTTVAFSLTGGNILKWYRDQFGGEEIREAQLKGKNVYEVILDRMSDQPTDLLVLPYFTPTGTPYFDPDVSGALFGLRLSTTREDICRAFLEGVAYEMRLNLEILSESGIPVKELRAIGGGAKNKKWLQLKADVIGTPITTVYVTEAAGMGAAMLACAAETKTSIDTIVKSWVKTTDVIEPNKTHTSFYTERFSTYKRLYGVIKSLQI